MRIKDLYLLIEAQAKEQMSELRYIDLQKRQIDRAADNYPMPLPAMLVEFGSVEYSNLARLSQVGVSQVSIYLYHQLITDTFDGAEVREETIKVLDLKDRVFELFQGLQLSDCTKLLRTSETELNFEDGYCWFSTTFTFSGQTKEELPQTIKIKPNINV